MSVESDDGEMLQMRSNATISTDCVFHDRMKGAAVDHLECGGDSSRHHFPEPYERINFSSSDEDENEDKVWMRTVSSPSSFLECFDSPRKKRATNSEHHSFGH